MSTAVLNITQTDRRVNRRRLREALLSPFDPRLIRDVYRSERGRRGKAQVEKVGRELVR